MEQDQNRSLFPLRSATGSPQPVGARAPPTRNDQEASLNRGRGMGIEYAQNRQDSSPGDDGGAGKMVAQEKSGHVEALRGEERGDRAAGAASQANAGKVANDVCFVLRKLYTEGGLDAQQQGWKSLPADIFNTLTLQMGTMTRVRAVSFFGWVFRNPMFPYNFCSPRLSDGR